MPPSESTATSVVPPPISTTREPVGSATGSDAPIAIAIGSSIRNTSRAPDVIADSRIARRSTWFEPPGTQITILGEEKNWFFWTLRMKYLSITSATVKSAITPSFSGRIACMLPGVRPSIILASCPTASTVFSGAREPVRIATTDGSFRITPRSGT